MCLSGKTAEWWNVTKSPSTKQEVAFSRNTVGNTKHLPAPSTFTTGISTYHFIAAAQPICLPANCFLPTIFPHIESSNPRALLRAPHFQNASPRSIDHKELSYSAWTLCISKRRKIHLLSFPLMKVLYSLYPTNFCITVSFVREDRSSLVYRN